MIDERVREALRAEAAEAPDAGDLWERTTGRIRRRRAQRWGGVTAVVLLAVAVAVVGLPVFDDEREVVLGDAATPEGWQDVAVANAVLSVPPDWQVVDVTGATPDPPSADEPEPEEPVLDDPEGVPAPEPEAVPCPPIDPERSALVYSDGAFPTACMEDPGALADGLAVSHLSRPPPGFPPAVLEEGERVQVGAVPARAVPALLVTEPDGATPEQAAAGDTTAFMAPGIGVAVEARADQHAEEIEAVLATLRPGNGFDEEGVVQGVAVVDSDDPDAPAEVRELVGWAVDAEGAFHRWLDERLTAESAGAAFWPAATASRFGAVIEVDERVRIVAARPGEPAGEYPFPEDLMPDFESVAWSPAGEAVAWVLTEPEPRVVTLDWGDPDRLVDGAGYEVTEAAVTGLPDPGRQPFSWFAWERDDDGEWLEVHHPDEGTFAAAVARDADGQLEPEDPVEFEPR